MSEAAPTRITIIRHWDTSGFDIVAENPLSELQVCEGLAYDEMLGVIARVMCPTKQDGTPNRHVGRPLFLSPPSKTNP